MILIAKTYMGVEDKVDGIVTVIDSGVIDHCFKIFQLLLSIRSLMYP